MEDEEKMTSEELGDIRVNLDENESNAFVVLDDRELPIAYIIKTESDKWSEEEMQTLMKLFQGVDNCETWITWADMYVNKEEIIEEIDMDKIQTSNKLREIDIDDIALSMEQSGLLNPITVMKKGEFYELIFGSRRFLAARRLGWKKIRANIL
jgi:hypothetical protein